MGRGSGAGFTMAWRGGRSPIGGRGGARLIGDQRRDSGGASQVATPVRGGASLEERRAGAVGTSGAGFTMAAWRDPRRSDSAGLERRGGAARQGPGASSLVPTAGATPGRIRERGGEMDPEGGEGSDALGWAAVDGAAARPDRGVVTSRGCRHVVGTSKNPVTTAKNAMNTDSYRL